MAVKRKAATRTRKSKQDRKLVNFRFEGSDYVLDLVRNQVYRNWMAVETNRGVAILGAYRSEQTATV